MEEVTTVGIDLAKNVFSLHGVDAAGRAVFRRTVRRDRLVETVASLSPCLIGMEACSGAHEWGRRFERHGHTVKLMAPKFVAPYRKSAKNDGNDAEAVCEAVTRPSMRFVPVKSIEQQALLALHRVRYGFVVERTAIINRLRGLMCEFGVVLPLRSVSVRRLAAQAAETLPDLARGAVGDLLSSCISSTSASMPTTARSSSRRSSRRRRGGSWRSAASAQRRRLPSLPRSATRESSRTGGSSLPGSAWCPISIPPVASHAWDISASAAMPIFATCSCRERARCCTVPLAARTGSRGGR